MSLLEVQDLSVHLERNGRAVPLVGKVSFTVEEGQVLCLVGESGCGKSLTALSLARLLPTPPLRCSGTILFEGQDVLQMTRKRLRQIRGGAISYIFQDPSVSLNPVMRVGKQILEALALHSPGQAHAREVQRLLDRVGIPEPELRMRQYPHQFSGGMQQRVMIAMALASRPRLLVADEPTTALDVTIQAQIIELLQELRGELGMSILLITHNLGVVSEMADRVAVMYAGEIVEAGRCNQVLSNPAHPYTRALLDSVPRIGQNSARLTAIPGTVPAPGEWPRGCRFNPRCPAARPDCTDRGIVFKDLGSDWQVRCLYPATTLPGSDAAPAANTQSGES
jgi:oligopeptide/dipeptide ABC transporter ATP-binding protein